MASCSVLLALSRIFRFSSRAFRRGVGGVAAIVSGATFVLYGALQMYFGVCRAGDPLIVRGVVFERPSVLNVFRARCRAVCARVYVVCVLLIAQMKSMPKTMWLLCSWSALSNGDGRKYVSRY